MPVNCHKIFDFSAKNGDSLKAQLPLINQIDFLVLAYQQAFLNYKLSIGNRIVQDSTNRYLLRTDHLE